WSAGVTRGNVRPGPSAYLGGASTGPRRGPSPWSHGAGARVHTFRHEGEAMRTLLRRLAAVGAAAGLVAGAAACEPIENAPPGGGEVVEETFTLGPFNLAPMG